MREIYQDLIRYIKSNQSVIHLVALDGDRAGQSYILTANDCVPTEFAQIVDNEATGGFGLASKTGIMQRAGGKYYVEQIEPEAELIIMGAGHVAMAVQKMAKMLGFFITVIDPRAEFATSERLQETDYIVCEPYESALAKLGRNPNAYYVITTPGHFADRVCALALLPTQSAYIGMIGSKTKVQKTKEALLEAGIMPADLAKLHAPIGIRLGGETPAEIAVSILAEIVSVRAKRNRQTLDEEVANAIAALKQTGVVVTIVTKHGSGPRGIGTRMLVTADAQYGTVGGGSIEFACLKASRQMISENRSFRLAHYDLSGAESADLGMICGGSVDVIFQMI